MLKLQKRYDNGQYTPFNAAVATPQATQASSDASSSYSYSSSSTPSASSSTYTPSTTSTDSTTYAAPTSTSSSTTYSAYSTSSSSSSLISTTSSSSTPSMTSSTPISMSTSSIISSSGTSRLPNSITLSRPGSTPSATSVLPLPTSSPAQLNSTDRFFHSLASSPMNIALTAIVSTGILIILIVIVSYILRKCIMKSRRKRVAIEDYEKENGSDRSESPPGWSPFIGGAREGEWDEKFVYPSRVSSERNFTGPRMPKLDYDSATPVNRYSTPPSPQPFANLPQRPVHQGLKTFHLPINSTLPLPRTRPALPITPASIYPAEFRPFALPAPVTVVVPAQPERPLSWSQWAVDTGVRAGVAVGLVGPRAPSPPAEIEAPVIQPPPIARRIAKVHTQSLLPTFQESPRLPLLPPSRPFVRPGTKSFGQRAMDLRRSNSIATSIGSETTQVPIHIPGVSKLNRSRLFQATAPPPMPIFENSRVGLQRSRTMISSSSEGSPSVAASPQFKTKSRVSLKVRKSTRINSVRLGENGRSGSGTMLSGREKLDRARALRKQERGY